MEIMVSLGFREVYNMLGGITDWEAAGYPVMTAQSQAPETSGKTISGSAEFEISNLVISPRAMAANEQFSVSVTVYNKGQAAGAYDIVLILNEVLRRDWELVTVSTQTFSKGINVPPGEARTVTFERLNLAEGIYTIEIDGMKDYLEVGC